MGAAEKITLAMWLVLLSAPAYGQSPKSAPAADVPLTSFATLCGTLPPGWQPADKDLIESPDLDFGPASDQGPPADRTSRVLIAPGAFPGPGATQARILSISVDGVDARDVLLSATLSLANSSVECFSTDTPSANIRILVPGGFNGSVKVSRQDNILKPLKVLLRVNTEDLARDDRGPQPWFVRSLSMGQAFRTTIEENKYEQLVNYARCEYLSGAERRDERTSPKTGVKEPGGCASDTHHEQAADAIYQWLSELLGRSVPSELAGRRGSLTEPIIAFFGIANVNQSILLDCRQIGRGRKSGTCVEYSEPWQTSLQRTDYVWAAYLEDTLTGFDTAIDVEFKRDAPDLDYEEFDARAPVQSSLVGGGPSGRNGTTSSVSASAARRTIRIGYRRFRVREAPSALRVAFTRQGPTYGLRQYQRVYRKRSSRWMTLAGTVIVTAKATEIQDARKLTEEPRSDFENPNSGRIDPDIGRAWVYTAISLRWPTARARSWDQPNWYQRLAWSAIPDITAGFSFRNGRDPYFIGGSWPIWNRLFATVGTNLVKDDVLRDNYLPTRLIPLGTNPDSFTKRRWEHEVLFGVAFDVFDSR